MPFSYLKWTNMPFSLFVYYNETVHSSKTTRVTTSVQENFFFVFKKLTQWSKNQASFSRSIFWKSDLVMKSAAQGGPDGGHHENFDQNRCSIPKPRFWRRKKFDFSSNLRNIQNLPSRPPLYFPLNRSRMSCLF